MDNKYIQRKFGGGGGGGKGGGGGSTEVNIDYHWLFSISEISCYEEPTIIWESRLGNVLCIGDGIKTEFYIPNLWQKSYTFAGGWGYFKFFPETIILYKDSLNNKLREGVDYNYDFSNGKVTFISPPALNSIICFTATYDPEQPALTTFRASFAFKELIRRIGLKYYKFEEAVLDTYEKVCRMAKGVMDVIWIPMMSGSIDIVYYPLISMGQTIYVKDAKTGFENIVFIKGFNKSLSSEDLSLNLDVLTYPSIFEIDTLGTEREGTNFQVELPDLIVSFIDETLADNEYWGDALYFRVKAVDSLGNRYSIYKNPTRISIILQDKVREFPSNENNINQFYPKNKRGIVTQYYSSSFRKAPGGEFANDSELQSYFPEFFGLTPRLFSKKQVNLKIKDEKTDLFTLLTREIIFGKKGLYEGYYIPLSPYPAFVTFWMNREHLFIIDKDKNLWICDTFFNTEKIATLDFLDNKSFMITSDGQYLYIVDNEAEHIKKYDIATKTYITYTINDCLCGSNVFSPMFPIFDENGHPLVFFRGYSNITDVPYVNYVNFIKIKGSGVKLNWKFTMTGRVFAGVPFIYKNHLYWGRIGMTLMNTEPYEGNHNWTSEGSCPLIKDNTNLVTKDLWGLNTIKTIYFTDKDINTLYCVAADASYMDDFQLSQVRLVGKEFAIGKRIDNDYDDLFNPNTDSAHWSRIAKFETSDPSDKTSWDVFPIYAIGDKIFMVVKGGELKRKLGRDFRYGIAYFDVNDKKLKILIAKWYGTEVYGAALENELIHTIWMRDKILLNWKDYENLLSLEDPIYEIQGV